MNVEEEFDKRFPDLMDNSVRCKRQETHPCTGFHSEPYLNDEEKERLRAKDIKAFIHQVQAETAWAENKEWREGRRCEICGAAKGLNLMSTCGGCTENG